MSTTGGGGNPILQLNQNNAAAGAGSVRFFKNTSTSGVGIGELSFQAKDSGGTQREYGRINSTIRNTGAGNQDGSFSFQALVNNTLTECMRINGADSQVEVLQPMDMNGFAITTSAGPSLLLDASTNSVPLVMQTANTGPTGSGSGLLLTGKSVLGSTGTAGTTGLTGIAPFIYSGNFLSLTINGVAYKMPLFT
jgi:hypothetical protein